jgi:hypothetical protein
VTLEDHDPEGVLTRLRACSTDDLESARRWFTSFGSCDVAQPLTDLRELGLVR